MGLKELRESKGLSQQKLADLSGLTQQRISALERGTDGRSVGSLTLSSAIKLADALKLKDLRKLLEA